MKKYKWNMVCSDGTKVDREELTDAMERYFTRKQGTIVRLENWSILMSEYDVENSRYVPYLDNFTHKYHKAVSELTDNEFEELYNSIIQSNKLNYFV